MGWVLIGRDVSSEVEVEVDFVGTIVEMKEGGGQDWEIEGESEWVERGGSGTKEIGIEDWRRYKER